MEKLTSILAVVDEFEPGVAVLAKAVQLARRFSARVDLMIADPSQAGAFESYFSNVVYEELTSFAVHGNGEPLHDLILRRVSEHRPDLVIKSAAGAHPLRRWALCSNDWKLADECPVPVMLAGQKRWADPVRFAAAVDISDEDAVGFARAILHTAGFLTLGCRGRLDVLYSEREEYDEVVCMKRAVKLAQLVREFHVGSERLQMFKGDPEVRLPPLIEARDYDVLVLGAVSHRSGAAIAFESLSSRLVDASAGDVVLVKANAAVAAVAQAHTQSGREQGLQERQEFV